MKQCDLFNTCTFIKDNMADMPVISEHLKMKYCCDSFLKCARIRIYLEFGYENVPSTLFPNQEDDVTYIAKHLRSCLAE